MTDVFINDKGELEFFQGNEWKANNLLRTDKESILYFPLMGFDYDFWIKSETKYHINNLLEELNLYLITNNLTVLDLKTELKDFVFNFKMEV